MPSGVSSLNCGSVVVAVALVPVVVLVGGSTVREDDVSMSTSVRGWANDDSPDSYGGYIKLYSSTLSLGQLKPRCS